MRRPISIFWLLAAAIYIDAVPVGSTVGPRNLRRDTSRSRDHISVHKPIYERPGPPSIHHNVMRRSPVSSNNLMTRLDDGEPIDMPMSRRSQSVNDLPSMASAPSNLLHRAHSTDPSDLADDAPLIYDLDFALEQEPDWLWPSDALIDRTRQINSYPLMDMPLYEEDFQQQQQQVQQSPVRSRMPLQSSVKLFRKPRTMARPSANSKRSILLS